MGYKINNKKFITALENSGGILQIIADRCNVTRLTVQNHIESHPELRPFIESESQKIIDVAENNLFDNVKGNNFWAVKYLLSTKGKGRGYIEKQEIEHLGELQNPVTINLIQINSESVKKEKIEQSKRADNIIEQKKD